MTSSEVPTSAELSATRAWSRRVRRIGGFIQVAFAAFWLARGSLAIGDTIGIALFAAFSVIVVAVVGYGIRATAGTAPRPAGPDARRIERAVTVATIVQLAASQAPEPHGAAPDRGRGTSGLRAGEWRGASRGRARRPSCTSTAGR
jgi:hypothetical protein